MIKDTFYEYNPTNRIVLVANDYLNYETMYTYNAMGRRDGGSGYAAFDYGPWGELGPSQGLDD